MSIRILIGDCREKLRDLPDQSVHCCVTSPPYFGLRDYGTAQWDGGDPACPHEPTQEWIDHNFNASSAFGEGTVTQSAAAKTRWYNKDGSCPCGATRIDRQMGLEPTPDEFVAGMVEVFRDVRRVLRDDGTLWLNIGDSYAGSNQTGGTSSLETNRRESRMFKAPKMETGCKPKDLIGIPWMLAFALRADGWFLRQDIIWSKPNPMPESVRDRCTKAHEYLFLLSKSPRYYFDAEAIAEPSIWANDPRNGSGRLTYDGKRQGEKGTGNEAFVKISESRNKRSVWEVATQPFSEAHFATYPPALIEPCILAGCPKGGTVLDPFGGAGTTGLVADRLGRNAILIELNPEYAALAERRLNADSPLFAEVKAA